MPITSAWAGTPRRVRQHAVRHAVRPRVRNLLRWAWTQMPPTTARDHGGHPRETGPRHSEDVAINVVGVEHLNTLSGQEPRETEPLMQGRRTVHVSQRYVPQAGAGPLVPDS